MEKKQNGFRVFGKVIEKESGRGIPGLRVKAVDKDLVFDDVLGTAVTDERGAFSIHYEGKDFRELFFDKKPDLYLKIKDSAGNLIYSSEDKVRYQADATEEFLVEISKESFFKLPWNPEASQELKRRIATDVKLMKELTQVIQSSFEKHQIDLKDHSYLFEPRIFELGSHNKSSLWEDASGELARALFTQLYHFEPLVLNLAAETSYQEIRYPWSLVGPLDPDFLRILEKHRLLDSIKDTLNQFKDDPVPISPTLSVMQQIVNNHTLLQEISEGIFGVLAQNGIQFQDNQSCVFVPIVFEAPVYAQQIGMVSQIEDIKGFGPEIYSDSNPLPAKVADAGLIKVMTPANAVFVPAIRIRDIWIEGIPAPEMLRALDVMREFV
jgi:hypothetical protein